MPPKKAPREQQKPTEESNAPKPRGKNSRSTTEEPLRKAQREEDHGPKTAEATVQEEEKETQRVRNEALRGTTAAERDKTLQRERCVDRFSTPVVPELSPGVKAASHIAKEELRKKMQRNAAAFADPPDCFEVPLPDTNTLSLKCLRVHPDTRRPFTLVGLYNEKRPSKNQLNKFGDFCSVNSALQLAAAVGFWVPAFLHMPEELRLYVLARSQNEFGKAVWNFLADKSGHTHPHIEKGADGKKILVKQSTLPHLVVITEAHALAEFEVNASRFFPVADLYRTEGGNPSLWLREMLKARGIPEDLHSMDTMLFCCSELCPPWHQSYRFLTATALEDGILYGELCSCGHKTRPHVTKCGPVIFVEFPQECRITMQNFRKKTLATKALRMPTVSIDGLGNCRVVALICQRDGGARHFVTYSWEQVTMKELMQMTDALRLKRAENRKKSPEETYTLLLLDSATQHLSKAFSELMKTEFPNIMIVYIPKGFTPFLQPNDVWFFKKFKPCVRSQQNRTISIDEMSLTSDVVIWTKPLQKMLIAAAIGIAVDAYQKHESKQLNIIEAWIKSGLGFACLSKAQRAQEDRSLKVFEDQEGSEELELTAKRAGARGADWEELARQSYRRVKHWASSASFEKQHLFNYHIEALHRLAERNPEARLFCGHPSRHGL